MNIPNIPVRYYNNVQNSIVDYSDELWNDILQFSKKYNNNDIKVSICITSIRPYLWQWFYTTLLANNVNFELIISGPYQPNFELPVNFKYIYSISKPMQSLQLSIFHSVGETLVLLADDVQSCPGTLDFLYMIYKDTNDYRCITVPNFIEKIGLAKSIEDFNNLNSIVDIKTNVSMRLVHGTNEAPVAYVGGLMSKKFFDELGGFDTKFIARFADLDLQMRAHKTGGIFKLIQNAWMVERRDLCRADTAGMYNEDWATWISLWFKNSEYNLQSLLENRNEEFSPYTINDTFHTKSQGRE